MILSLILASFFSAFAAEPVAAAPVPVAGSVTVVEDSQIPLPAFGVNLVIGSDCSVKVVGHVPAAKAGTLAVEVSRATSGCLTAKALRDDKARADLASSARSTSLDKLIVSAGEAGEKGIDVRVVTSDTTVEMGDHLDWKAFAEASSNGSGLIPGMPLQGVSPDAAMLYRLGAGQAAFGAHPAIPGVVMPTQPVVVQPPPSAQPAASSDSAALGACRKALEAKGKLLETCVGGS